MIHSIEVYVQKQYTVFKFRVQCIMGIIEVLKFKIKSTLN